MWNRPRLLIAIADLVFLMVGVYLIMLAVSLIVRLPLFPLREVVFTHPVEHLNRDEIRQALSGEMTANFFNLRVEEVQHKFEALPWVRRAAVRRSGPYRLEITLEEHRPVACWGEPAAHQWINDYGEIFSATMCKETLPRLDGPPEASHEILGRFKEFTDILRPTGLRPIRLSLSPRQAWRLFANDGSVFELGREQRQWELKERLTRFVASYPALQQMQEKWGGDTIERIDLRYPNGFALRLTGNQNAQKEGT